MVIFKHHKNQTSTPDAAVATQHLCPRLLLCSPPSLPRCGPNKPVQKWEFLISGTCEEVGTWPSVPRTEGEAGCSKEQDQARVF